MSRSGVRSVSVLLNGNPLATVPASRLFQFPFDGVCAPSEWINAASNRQVSQEFQHLEQLVAQVDKSFHALLINQRALWLHKDPHEVITAANLACKLTPAVLRGDLYACCPSLE